MWVFGMFVCLLPAVAITLELLSPRIVHSGASLRNASEAGAQKILLG
jgi:hypothetical protein